MTRDLTRARAGCELHFLATHTLPLCASWLLGRQGSAESQAQPHRRCDSWAVAAVRSHNPITRSQSHIMSPDTSTSLLTLAWLVSIIATVVKVKMLVTSRFVFVQVFLISLTLCDNSSEKTNRSKLETFWSRRKHRIEAQSLGDFGK